MQCNPPVNLRITKFHLNLNLINLKWLRVKQLKRKTFAPKRFFDSSLSHCEVHGKNMKRRQGMREWHLVVVSPWEASLTHSSVSPSTPRHRSFNILDCYTLIRLYRAHNYVISLIGLFWFPSSSRSSFYSVFYWGGWGKWEEANEPLRFQPERKSSFPKIKSEKKRNVKMFLFAFLIRAFFCLFTFLVRTIKTDINCEIKSCK